MNIEDVRRMHGEWTAMSIHLGEGAYTLAPQPDARLRRLVQVAADLAGKPLASLRVLDLACLEGHYGIEFALHGADVVGIELRDDNLAKAQFARDYLKLDRLALVKDDVRNVSVERYGRFDVVLCSGILYHLPAPDVFRFVRSLSEVCSRLAIIDTFVALRPEVTLGFEGQSYSGLWYREHDESAAPSERLRNLHASVDNASSFWLTPASLANLVAHVGFSSFYECLKPEHDVPCDRRAYVAMRGQPAAILSSPPTRDMPHENKPEQARAPMYRRRGPIFRMAKRVLPQPAKNLIKPALRAVGMLPPDGTPPWLKRN
jgi:hypothetical protein